MLRQLVYWVALLACVGGTILPVQAATPNDLIPITNLSQILTPGATVPLIVRVVDENSLPVSGVAVSFSAPGLTPLGQTVVTSAADGLAQATFAVPNVESVFYASVAVAGLSPRFFTIKVTGTVQPPPGGTGGMQIVAGNGQVVLQSSPTAKPLIVSLTDANNVPYSGVEVTWTVSTGLGPSLSATSTLTDASGQASINVIGAALIGGPAAAPFLQSTITAEAFGSSVNFALTTLGNGLNGQPTVFSAEVIDPGSRTIVARAGQTLPAAIRIRTTASFATLSNVGVELVNSNMPGVGPTAACANGLVLTDFRGVATCDLVVGTRTGDAQLSAVVGGVRGETFSLHVDPGPPSLIKILQGDGQTGNTGQTLPLALTALVTDAYNNVLPGAPVQWEVVTSGSVALSPPTFLTTDVNGRASTRLTLGRLPGSYSVVVRAGDASGRFTVTAVAPYSQVRVLFGDKQKGLVNIVFPTPLIIQVADDAGNPAQGVAVNFSVVSGDATLSTLTTTTAEDGRASTIVQAGPTAGPIAIQATAGRLPPVTFALTSREPGPVVDAKGILNAAGFQPGVVPGGLVTIMGSGIAPDLQGCVSSGSTAAALPTSLAGVSVLFGKHTAPVLSVCNTNGTEQVTVQAPFELAAGTAPITVTTAGGSTVVNGATIFTAQPGIFESPAADGRPFGAIQRADGSLAGPDNPVQRGEIVRLYATGLGPVLPRAGTNQPGIRGQAVFLPVVVGVNNAGARVVSAEYAENMIGVYVITFEVPSDAASGSDLPLSVAVMTALGQSPVYSNPSRIAVQ